MECADIIHCFLPFAIEIEAKRYADKIGKPSTAAFHIQPQNLWSSVGLGKVDWIQNGTYLSFSDFLYNKFWHIHAPSQFMADEIKQCEYMEKLYAKAAKKYSLSNSVRMFEEMLNEEMEDCAKHPSHS